MPICAVIDDAVFCAHGGIPTSVQVVSQMKMPPMMREPEREYPAAWEVKMHCSYARTECSISQMLWNDPINETEYEEFKEMIRTDTSLRPDGHSPYGPAGFLTNTKRGTAFFWSEGAASNRPCVLRPVCTCRGNNGVFVKERFQPRHSSTRSVSGWLQFSSQRKSDYSLFVVKILGRNERGRVCIRRSQQTTANKVQV